MKQVYQVFPLGVSALLFLSLLVPVRGYATMENVPPVTEQSWQDGLAMRSRENVKKPGLFKKVRMFRQAKKALKQQVPEGEKASKLARIALILFISWGVLALIPVPFISGLAGIAWLVSVVLAFIILFGEENRKSKAIAKAILIISAVLLVAALVLFAIWASAWGW
ncbi:MAG: hypothetical protein EP344_13225 [Bacteroidetes bacterium]|nr:MAG: hypothetical protein EP344_13225 [Bacteroidota bacterium]